MTFELLPPSVVPNQSVSRTFDEFIALADEKHDLYQRNADKETLDQAIHHYRTAFDLCSAPDTTIDLVYPYFRFRKALLSLDAQLQGDTIADSYLDKILRFTPGTHDLRPTLLGLQAASYKNRYQLSKDTVDLDLAVERFRTVLSSIPITYPQRMHLQMQYGSTLLARYMVMKSEADLHSSIHEFETVLKDCPSDLLLPARWSLACALDSRYNLRYDIDYLDPAVEAYAAVVNMLQQPSPREYLFACGRYSVFLGARWHRRENLDDLHLAVRYSEVVVKRCPPGDQNYFIMLALYTSLLTSRWEQRNSIEDIDTAIECLRNGMAAGNAHDPKRPVLLSHLGNCLTFRFLHCGNPAELESAIENCYVAISQDSSVDAGARASNMNRLAFALYTRYQLQGDDTDVDNARSFLEKALELCPPDPVDRLPILNNYARMLANLGRKNPGGPDLQRSVEYFYNALELSHALARSTLLSNLALALIHRYSVRSDLSDLSDVEVSFSLSKTALSLQSKDHPLRAVSFLVQAKAVIAMFPPRYTIVHTEIALDVLRAALDAFTMGHPLRIETYRELSRVYHLRYSITQKRSDLEEAFKYRIEAAQYSNGGSQVQFEAALSWVENAETFSHPSLLEAYRFAIRILDLHLVLKPALRARHTIIENLSICADGTSCALRSHDVVGAVELFEHSRGMFWTFMARLRTPLDELRASGSSGRVLADGFGNLSRQLEMPTTTGDSVEHGQRFRRIQRDWNAAVDKIRSTDGFGKFLLPPSYEDLRMAATGGPVIILNASKYSCDAIVVLANAEPVHIPFREDTYSELNEMSIKLQELRDRLSRHTNTKAKQMDEKDLITLLRKLWDNVISDVVRGLEPHIPRNSRIWWCPTGVFTRLPIHAAKPYRKGQLGLSDIYVSSYTPTLSALIRGRSKQSVQGGPRFVSIGQPKSDGYEELIAVRSELDLVHQLVPESIPFTELTDEKATCEAALSALSTHSFVHLACHGQQVDGKPYESHFAMHDGQLTLLDIVHREVGPQTEFAFLSACKTAMGDEKTPEEVLHLAAALQFAGVRSVIGTMWKVDDNVVIHTIGAFYRAMVNEEGVFDPSRAARALRAATRATTDLVPVEQRLVFIHIGV